MSSPTAGSEPDHPQGDGPQREPSWGASEPQGDGSPAPSYGDDPDSRGTTPGGYGSTPGEYGDAPRYGSAPAGEYGNAPVAGYGGAPAGARPPQVIVAAILGFVVALFALIGALGFFALSRLLGIFVLFAILYLGLAALNVWGGVVAMQGRNSTILKIAGLITAGLALIGLILALTQGSFSFWSIVLIAAGAAMFFLLNQPVSKQFFAAHGGT